VNGHCGAVASNHAVMRYLHYTQIYLDASMVYFDEFKHWGMLNSDYLHGIGASVMNEHIGFTFTFLSTQNLFGNYSDRFNL
jgi:hypothetical protein